MDKTPNPSQSNRPWWENLAILLVVLSLMVVAWGVLRIRGAAEEEACYARADAYMTYDSLRADYDPQKEVGLMSRYGSIMLDCEMGHFTENG